MSFTGTNRAASAPRIKAWSFSRLKTYLQCPAKLKYAVIDKLPEPESEAMVEGHRIHKAAEAYLKREVDDIDDALAFFAEDIAAMRDACAQSELQLAFTADLKETSWFGKDAWVRVIYDVFILNDDGSAWVGDWKTGKPRKEDNEQLSLFALTVFLKHPEVHTVHTELLYTKTGSVSQQTFTRADAETLKTYWVNKAAPMLADEQFLPTPNGLCGYCHYRKANGGPCRY